MSDTSRPGHQTRPLTENERRELARLVADWVVFGADRPSEPRRQLS